MNSKQVHVLKTSPWTKANTGTPPARIVLWHRKGDNSFVTDREIKQRNGALSFVHGLDHHWKTIEAGITSFNKRVETL